MPAVVFDEDDPLFDPDDLKMPESPAHRRSVDVIALAAAHLLGPDQRVFRDMNWYPVDGGNALAPDVMVLPAGAMPTPVGPVGALPKSYRQDETGGPSPTVVVEVPSGSDGFDSMLTKTQRCRGLGAVVYLVSITADPPALYRFTPDRPGPEPWLDRPIDELGGIRIGFDDGTMTVTLPDGLRVTSDEALADELRRRVDRAESRADRLAHRLRELGVDPSSVA